MNNIAILLLMTGVASSAWALDTSKMRPSDNVEDRRQELPTYARELEQLRQEQLKVANTVAKRTGLFSCAELKPLRPKLLKTYEKIAKATPAPAIVAKDAEAASLRSFANVRVDMCSGGQSQQANMLGAAQKKAEARFRTFIKNYEKERNELMAHIDAIEAAVSRAKEPKCAAAAKQYKERAEKYVEVHDEVSHILFVSQKKIEESRAFILAKSQGGCQSAGRNTASGKAKNPPKTPAPVEEVFPAENKDELLSSFNGDLAPDDELRNVGAALSK